MREVSLLSDCLESVHWWFTLNGLSLNPDKSEAIINGTGARQRSEGSLEAHVNSVCKAVNYHAKALRHIRKRVTTNVALTIASTMVGARLDYCNAILHGSSKSNIQKLQRAPNSIACIVTGTHEVIRTYHTCTRLSSGIVCHTN